MGEVISWLGSNWQLLVGTAGTIVMGASIMVKAIAPLTKNKQDDKLAAFFDKVQGWFSKIALNSPKE